MSGREDLGLLLREQFGGRLTEARLGTGDTLFRQGDPADAVFLIVEGRLRVTQDVAQAPTPVIVGGASPPRDPQPRAAVPQGSVMLGDLRAGEVVGELGALTAGTRTASVAAVEESRLLRLGAAEVDALIETAPAIAERLAELVRERLRRSHLAAALAPLLGPLDPAALEEIEGQVDWVSLAGGEVLLREGEADRSLYILLSGRLHVRSAEWGVGNDLPAPHSEVAPGESVGEMALLTGEPRTGEVRALRDSVLARLSPEAFEALRARHPEIVAGLARVLARRLRARERPEPARQRTMSFALVPAGPDVPLGEVAARLATALSRLGSTLHLSRDTLDRLTGLRDTADIEPGAPRSGWLAAWLDEQETQHRFFILQADAADSTWTRRCIREADRVVLVAAPAPGDCGVRIADYGVRSETSKPLTLVLLHPQDAGLPSGTQAWLDALSPAEHYHIRQGKGEDMARLARCLAGRAVGLALGGGGARGLAHLGVIRALCEAGVPVDRVAGASMGAVIGAAFAMEMDYATELSRGRRVFIQGRPHKEYTLPILSLLRGRRLDRLLPTVYGEARIEDLWLPFLCVSCNLTTTDMEAHQRGPAWKAVRASASLPGVFPPVIQNGHLLVDGGVLNNLPGDLLRRAGCERVIAVAVSPPTEMAVECEEFPSPWRLLWDRLRRRGGGRRVPGIFDILIRTLVIGSDRKAEEVKRDADLCLRPPVERYGVLQFEAMEEIAEAGYAYTRELLGAPDRPPWLGDFLT